MTSSDIEWPFHASRTISAVADSFVIFLLNPFVADPVKALHFAMLV